MFSKWMDEFKSISQRWRFVSRFGSFLIAIFTLLSLYDVAWALYFNQTAFKVTSIWISISFQVIILLLFITRFSLSFFTSARIFWISQILWFAGVSIFIGYWLYSTMPTSGVNFSSSHKIIFSNSSNAFEGFGIYYLFLSPFIRISFGTIALVKSLKRND